MAKPEITAETLKEIERRYPNWVPRYLERFQGDHPWINLYGKDAVEPDDLVWVLCIRKDKAEAWIRADSLEPASDRERETIERESKVYRVAHVCDYCLEEIDPKDVDNDNPIYECEDDGRFTREESADSVSNRCPDCRKWGRKVADGTCPKCGEGAVEIKRIEVTA